MLLFCHQNVGQNWNIKKETDRLKICLGATVTNENLTHEEIKRRLNSGNACYLSVQALLSSCLLSKDVRIVTYRIIILPVVLYVCKTLSLTLRKTYRLRCLRRGC
jgi:hypothetical protein